MEYFSRNPCITNILRILTPRKILNRRILRPKYPWGGGGTQQSRKPEPLSSKKCRTKRRTPRTKSSCSEHSSLPPIPSPSHHPTPSSPHSSPPQPHNQTHPQSP